MSESYHEDSDHEDALSLDDSPERDTGTDSANEAVRFYSARLTRCLFDCAFRSAPCTHTLQDYPNI